MIDQAIIAITGVVAIFLTQSSERRWQKYACIVGLVGQPFWIIATLDSNQWGMFVLSVFYTLAWIQGVRNFWFKCEKNK